MFCQIRNYDFHIKHISIMKLIVIWTESWNNDNERFTSKSKYAVLEKWIFENFRGSFYDDVIPRDNSYLWSNEVIIKAKDFSLMLEKIHLSSPTAWELQVNYLK